MSTRQYIGARYVPKFFDWDGSTDWRSGVAYEALTIVTRNGNSYTSKIPVPSNIGAPEENPTYWAATGLYNEQIESIRTALLKVQGDVSDVESGLADAESDIEALGGRVTTAEGNISAVEDDVDTLETRVDRLSRRKLVFIGDSYIQGGEMINGLVSIMGGKYVVNTNLFYLGVGGAGFAAISSTNKTFITEVAEVAQMVTNAGVDVADITDVFFVGGTNDSATAYLTLVSAVQNGVATARTTFHNADVHIVPLGTNGIPSGRINTYKNMIMAYQMNNAIFWQNASFVIHSLALLQDDLLHPNQYGMERCAYYLKNILNGRDVLPTRHATGEVSGGAYGNVIETWTDSSGITFHCSSLMKLYDKPFSLLNNTVVDFGTVPDALDILPSVVTESATDLSNMSPIPVMAEVYSNSNIASTAKTVIGEMWFKRDTDGHLHMYYTVTRALGALNQSIDRINVSSVQQKILF